MGGVGGVSDRADDAGDGGALLSSRDGGCHR